MDDLISRQDAIEILAVMQGQCTSRDALIQNSKIWQQIKDLPSAQHTATWELDEQQEHVEKIWHCSNCGYRAWGSYEKTDFCGGCGAKMEY